MKMICLYCKGFMHSDVIKTAKNALNTRKCIKIGVEVTAETQACSEFESYNWFFCEKSIHWIELKVCRHRKQSKNPMCTNCKQYEKYIKYIIFTKKSTRTLNKIILD